MQSSAKSVHLGTESGAITPDIGPESYDRYFRSTTDINTESGASTPEICTESGAITTRVIEYAHELIQPLLKAQDSMAIPLLEQGRVEASEDQVRSNPRYFSSNSGLF
eukprot:495115-Rhodomonas_salina.1